MDKMESSFSAVCEEAAAIARDRPTAHFRPDARQQAAEPKRTVTRNSKSLLCAPCIGCISAGCYAKSTVDPFRAMSVLSSTVIAAMRVGMAHDPYEIYQRGAEKLDDILDWCAALGIPAVTLWVFSTTNLKRSPIEVSGILTAIESKLTALAQHPFTHRQQVRVRAIGRLDILPAALIAAIGSAEAATAQYNAMTLTIAVAYGGREEIVDAVRSFLKAQADEGAVIARRHREHYTRHSSSPSLRGGSARS